MYCPKCATPLSDDSKFCRACGLDLEIISQLLGGDSSQSDKLKTIFDSSTQLKSRKKRLQNLGALVMMLSFVVGALIPIVIGLGYENLNSLVMILAGIAGVILFGGISLAVYADIEPKNSSLTEEVYPKALSPEKRNNQLPSADYFEPVPSIIEEETRGLETNKIKILKNRAE